MWCGDLALTGSGPVLLQILGATAVVLIGLVLLLRRRRQDGAHRRTPAALGAALVLLVVIGTAVIVPGPQDAARAACTAPVSGNSLTIVQTSTMTGLAPGRAPAAITGIVTNNGSDDTVIVAIDVSIASVAKAPGTPAGICDASDYILLAPRMIVGATLPPGGSTPFSGASIGFRNGLANQNACKSAIVNLVYATVP